MKPHICPPMWCSWSSSVFLSPTAWQLSHQQRLPSSSLQHISWATDIHMCSFRMLYQLQMTHTNSSIPYSTQICVKVKESKVNVDLYSASMQKAANALRYGSHSVTCKQHHICLYSPVAEHHRPLTGTHCAYPRRDGQAELTWFSNQLYHLPKLNEIQEKNSDDWIPFQ